MAGTSLTYTEDSGIDGSVEPVGYQGRPRRLPGIQLRPRDRQGRQTRMYLPGSQAQSWLPGTHLLQGPHCEAGSNARGSASAQGVLALPCRSSHSRGPSHWGPAELSLPPGAQPLPLPRGAPGLHSSQKQDADSEKGAMTEAGVWGWGSVLHRERTGLQREASRDPEVGGDRNPGEEGVERDRDSERR